MEAGGVVAVGPGKGVGAVAGRRMSLRGAIPVEEIGCSADESGIDAADTWLVRVMDPVCQETAPLMLQEKPKIHTKTVFFSKLRSAPLYYRVFRMSAF